MKLMLHPAQILCCSVVLFVMNLTSVFNWAGIVSMVLLGYILDTYLLSFELVYPNLIFALSTIVVMQGFAECKIRQGMCIIIAETHTWAIHTRSKQDTVENRHGRAFELKLTATRGRWLWRLMCSVQSRSLPTSDM